MNERTKAWLNRQPANKVVEIPDCQTCQFERIDSDHCRQYREQGLMVGLCLLLKKQKHEKRRNDGR